MQRLDVNELRAGYDRKVAVIHGVDLQVDEREIVALLGPNGSGKSTLLKTIVGLTVYISGTIRFRDSDIHHVPTYQMMKLGVGYVPQQDAVFPNLTVKENLAIGSRYKRQRAREGVTRVLETIPRISNRLGVKAGALSGGEQRMVAIGRALMSSPSLLLLDEPTAGLAPKAGVEVLEEIDALRTKLGLGVLLVEQNARAAIEISDHVLVLAAGEIAFAGSREQAIADQDLANLYLGAAVDN